MELGHSGQIWAASVSRLPLRRGGRRPPPAGPWANPRQGGDAPRDTRPGLIGAWTAAGRAELGRTGWNRAASVSRLPLRRGGRRPPPAGPWPNPRRGGDAPRDTRPGLIGARTAAGRAELGRTGWNRAASVSRLPLRRGGRRPPPAGPWANPRQGGDAPRDTRPGLIGAWTAPGRVELGHSGQLWAASVSRLPLRRGGRRPPPAGPWPNPRRGGDAPRDTRPGLIGARTAAGRAELGRTGWNRAASVSRLPLRRAGRRPPPAGPWPNPRQGGDAPRERRPGLIGARTAPGRAELGHPGQIGAASVSRLPLRRGGRRPPPAGPWPNPRRGGDAPRETRPGLIGARTAAGRAELGRTGWNRAASASRLPLRRAGRRPPPAGPWPNPRQGGDAPRDTRPGLIGARTAAGRAELGRSGFK